MQVWVSKCATLEVERGQIVQSEGIELPNIKIIKSLEKFKNQAK